MYTNFFAWLFLNNPDPNDYWVPSKYYDIFSWRGFWDFLIESQLFMWLIPWDLMLLTFRFIGGDWNWAQNYEDDPVDMNRFIPDLFPADPEDRTYWKRQSNGVDCNGNVGNGLYCYCPSQGYNCACEPKVWFSDKPRVICETMP